MDEAEKKALAGQVARKILRSSEYIVMTSSAQVYGGVRYRNVAVCEVERGVTPKMISQRAKGMVRIVRRWNTCKVGKTAASEYGRALAEAEALAEQLNS